MTTALPEDAKTNAAGVPHYLGLTGNKLITAITATATTVSRQTFTVRRPKGEGIANAFVWRPCAGFPPLRIRPGSHEWTYYRQGVHPDLPCL